MRAALASFTTWARRPAVHVGHVQTVLEFGANWCPICQGAQPLIAEALGPHPGLRHLKVADGRGKPLGRSFKVKLWPTMVFLRDGREVARVVRPTRADEVTRALAQLVE